MEGLFPWDAIDDETRPEELNNHHWSPWSFFQGELNDFMTGYQRNRQQSQPDHIEIVGEKLTVRSILASIAADHSIPLSIGRGHSGPTFKRKIAQRFERSGKDRLVLLVVSDLDPAGESIVQNFKDALINDFDIDDRRLIVRRAGLNMDRVNDLGLTVSFDADEKDASTKQAFIDKYGASDCWELEAMEPGDLQNALIEDIDAVIDIDAFNAEVEREKQDAVAIAARKAMVMGFLKTLPEENNESNDE